jgi:hypothetical protein
VKYKNRAWLSQVEAHFLLDHPEIAKLLQQRRWYKKLMVFSDPNEPDCVKRLNLTTYKSDWLKIHTLLEMGIEFFLNPESRWSQHSPEAVEFWEKGKDAQRSKYIGTTVGDSNPCEYIGRVLGKLDIKQKGDPVKNDAGKKIRVYRMDTDYLSTPMRSAVYECVKQRVESVVQTDSLVLNWDAIVENRWANETAQKVDVSMPEIPSTQAIEVGHLPLNFSINQGGGVPASQGSYSLEEVAEALPYCQSPEDLMAIAAGCSSEVMRDAIALTDSQPRRLELARWYQQLANNGETQGVVRELLEAFQFCEDADLFATVIEGYPIEVVEDAIASSIALADTHPKRQHLLKWWDEISAAGHLASQTWEQKVKVYSTRLIEAISFGLQAVRELLNPLSDDERWSAVAALEEASPGAMVRLMQLDPNWTDLCVVW